MSASHIRTTCLAAAVLSFVSATAMALTGTATRQQIISSEASTYTIAKALARAKAGPINALVTDNGSPTAGVALFTADYAVAADGPTRYRSVQSAIDAAVAAGGNTRRYISIKAGTYTELICVPSNAPPLTLSGLGTNTGDTIIRFNNANPTPKPAGTASHPCASNASATTVCTSNSATVTVRAANFEAPHLRVDNDYVEGTYTDNNQSAVALAVRGDKANFQDVLVSSNQDTLVISASSASDVIRAYFKSRTMGGDVDFSFSSGAFSMVPPSAPPEHAWAAAAAAIFLRPARAPAAATGFWRSTAASAVSPALQTTIPILDVPGMKASVA